MEGEEDEECEEDVEEEGEDVAVREIFSGEEEHEEEEVEEDGGAEEEEDKEDYGCTEEGEKRRGVLWRFDRLDWSENAPMGSEIGVGGEFVEWTCEVHEYTEGGETERTGDVRERGLEGGRRRGEGGGEGVEVVGEVEMCEVVRE